ncbi:hypothetical protein Rsub_11796 [Raphidocelis subcapitata]|uniref:Flagellar associated protein n=1 Tax=Raphidocelis subcapitata TaxID=307507 RepID=A0A2V0PIY5_9CHLO|nr:hypothetical protein Rsub_11796 [Raphidocelis subcapitata]|eukprot:GBF98992.1 hypothetical protein Rsub_11796 [Raphidocelis subcapitata]
MSTPPPGPQGEPTVQAASNFHNAEPRTREERLAAQSREKLEKQQLRARRGCFHRYEEPGSPLVPEPKSPMYADESDRFRRDAAAEMRQQKVEAWKRQQEVYDRKRVELMGKEQQRWEHMAEEAAAEAARMEADEMTRYRSTLRSQFLFNKHHSVPHNILTGEVRPNPAAVPPAPQPPEQPPQGRGGGPPARQ